MHNSKFFNLNWADFGKGLLLSVLASIITVISQSVDAGSIKFDWSMIGRVALLSGLAYITKNLMTNSGGIPMKREDDTKAPK